MAAEKLKKQKKAAGRSLSANTWLGILLIILSAGSLTLAIHQSFSRELTGLEATLFSSITFVLSIVGSFIVSAHFSQSQARKEYEQLARPALRRVDSLQQALLLVAANVDARLKELRSDNQGDPENITWLRGHATQLQLLSHTIRDATSDWRELLPEDYEDALRRAFDDLGSSKESIEELKSQIEEQKSKQAQGDESAKAAIAKLELELKRARQEAASRGTRQHSYLDLLSLSDSISSDPQWKIDLQIDPKTALEERFWSKRYDPDEKGIDGKSSEEPK